MEPRQQEEGGTVDPGFQGQAQLVVGFEVFLDLKEKEDRTQSAKALLAALDEIDSELKSGTTT